MKIADLFPAHDKPGSQMLDEDLRKWFKDKWVRFGPDGEIRGSCARGKDSEGKPKCLPQKKAWALGKKQRATAARRKRREDPHADRSGAAKMVATKESVGLQEGTQENRDLQVLADAAGRWINKNVRNKQQFASIKFHELAKLAGIFDHLGSTVKSLLTTNKEWPLNLSMAPESNRKSLAVYVPRFNEIVIYLKDHHPAVIPSSVVHELQHALDDMNSKSKLFKNYVTPTDKSSAIQYMKHPSEVNARLAEVLLLLAKMKVDKSNFTATLARLLDMYSLSPRGDYALDDQVYRRLLSRAYKFYTESQSIQAVNPWKVALNKILYRVKQVVNFILGPGLTEHTVSERKDACYHKVKSRYKVWPSAYASGALVQCRKKGAKNWGNK